MSNPNVPPFQYEMRARMVEPLEGQMWVAAMEQRDRELEDFLRGVDRRIDAVDVGGVDAFGPWTALPLLSPFTAVAGWQAPQYRTNGDIVELRGLIAHTANLNGATVYPISNLAALGIFPAAQCVFTTYVLDVDNGRLTTVRCQGGNLIWYVDNLILYDANGWTSLEGIRWSRVA